jgi:1,2-diacylglycerol 3-alpha-glucosyltransferase
MMEARPIEETVQNGAISTAVIFLTSGPYHLARARALDQTDGLHPTFIQLASAIATHPWRADESSFEPPIRTVAKLPYQDCSYFELSRELWKILDETNPAVVATSLRPFAMLSAARWARSRGRGTVLFYETTPDDKPRRAFLETVKRELLKRYYDAAFVGGRVSREYLIDLGMPAGRIWQGYDVVDNEYFANSAASVRKQPTRWREQLGLPERYFLYVGRYSGEKNLLRLLDAYHAHRQSDAFDGWSLVMVGEGPQHLELERFIADKRIEGVFLKPFAQLEDLPAHYALADCFILPSTVEPWGLVVNEAMACGLPVLVSKVCGCMLELVVEGDNGFCFEPHDTSALTALMGRLSSRDVAARDRMGVRSREIVARFTPRTWADNLASCVRTVAAERQR